MEVSKPLQADIINIQNQLKIAIKNHQILVVKLQTDPMNVQMKKQLLGVQKHILLLGESQKELVQQLRKELEANSTNSTLRAKSMPVSLGTNKVRAPCIVREKCTPVRPSSVSSTSSSTTSEDSQEVKCCSPGLTTKLQFMNAVGLVTREVLSELQNRRVERKRRSTANHTQFVYGSSWDVSKRKKSSYLTTGSVPATRQLTRNLRTEPAETEKVASPPQPSLVSLHIPGLPPSLTIERVQTEVCAICSKSGSLSVCGSCSAKYHCGCGTRCPQCGFKQENDVRDREAERERLLARNNELNGEMEVLDCRASELRSALLAQAKNRKEMLRAEEETRKSIERLQDFVSVIKSARSPPSPS